MITFKQFLSEIFDVRDIYPYKVHIEDESWIRVKFNDYTVDIDVDDMKNHMGLKVRYTVAFFIPGVGMMPTRNQSLGDALKVYNTIGDIIKKVIAPRMKTKDLIQFEAVVSKTRGIYEKLGKMIAKEINGTYVRIDSSTFRVIKT